MNRAGGGIGVYVDDFENRCGPRDVSCVNSNLEGGADCRKASISPDACSTARKVLLDEDEK